MANHPSRNKPSRDALEMIAHFARHGIALEREQQEAVVTICRKARVVARVATEECNGPWWGSQPIGLGGLRGEAATRAWEEWQTGLDRHKERARSAILKAIEFLPMVENVELGGDPRGATVKLVMVHEWRRLHDSFGGDAYCVPGS